MRGTSQPNRSGTLTVLGLIALGAVPVLAFSAWLPAMAGRVPVSLLPLVAGYASPLHGLGAVILGVAFADRAPGGSGSRHSSGGKSWRSSAIPSSIMRSMARGAGVVASLASPRQTTFPLEASIMSRTSVPTLR
jgi:hypothetical protein